MVCGGDLEYLQDRETMQCYYCGVEKAGNAVCSRGHFVCDACHAKDALSIIKEVCLNTDQKDMIALLKKIRSHAAFPVHGPEHHGLIPAVVLAVYRNSGGMLSRDRMLAGINRGAEVPGGACGFYGSCGVALGVGTAFSIILEANPLKSKARRIVQAITAEVLKNIAEYNAPRCCQRECYIGLLEAARLSDVYLDVKLTANEPLACAQHAENKECIGKACPLWREDSATSTSSV